MFSYFKAKKEQKELYYQLNNAISLECNSLHGIYVIFKNDLCLYVGQSKNIPSRLATHLKGKYKNCSRIIVYEAYFDFQLIESEKYLINHYKPIENVLVDYDSKIDKSKTIDIIHDILGGADVDIEDYFDIELFIKRDDIFISNRDLLPNELNALDKRVQSIIYGTMKTKKGE